jgi:hypothetical protein
LDAPGAFELSEFLTSFRENTRRGFLLPLMCPLMTDSGIQPIPNPLQPAGPGGEPPRPPDPATWAALLARWVEFARAAVSLPSDNEGTRWRRAVPPIITLQAVAHALAELDRLPSAEQALALDRGSVLIRDNAATLNTLWQAEPLPDRVLELIEDAQHAHDAAASRGRHWIVMAPRFVMPALDATLASLVRAGFSGDLLAALPGTILFQDEPALMARPDAELSIAGLRRAGGVTPGLQVYRQVDPQTGRVERDLIAPLHASLPPGRPLLIPLIKQGRPTNALRDHDAQAWQALQRGLLPNDPVPITWEC